MNKPWFSIYDFSFDYKGNEPPFSDPYQFKWASDFEALYPEIKKELENYLKDHHLASYFSASMVSQKNTWKTVSLKTWGIEMNRVQKEFPKTSTLLSQYPEIVSASFSLLEPNSNIKPHCGDTNAVYRCHMGIDVPAGLPHCGIKVQGESKSWENGEWFAFMDAYVHEAWNHTDKARLVLIVDVIREEFKSKQESVCATVHTSLFLQKRFNDLTNSPVFAKVSARLLKPFIQLGIFVVNKLRYY